MPVVCLRSAMTGGYGISRRSPAHCSSKRNTFFGSRRGLVSRLACLRQQSRRLQYLNISAIAAPELGTPDAIAGTAAGDPGKYQNTDWASAFTSQLQEYDYWVTDVEGVVPDTLRGTLFRNGPGRFERGQQKYEHMLDGDGYVCSFSFNNEGRMHFRSAYVRTSELEKEAEADAVLYRNTFGTQPRKPWGPLQNAFDLYLKNPANTNVVLWGNRLLALWEAGCPFEMDPHTLETHPGPETLGGFLRSGIAPSTTGADFLDKAIGLGKACTAHPHVVHGQGVSDRLAIFSWQSQIKPLAGSEMTIDINEFDENWQKVAGQKFTMHKSFFNPHDFAVSKNYYVFFQNAMSFKMGQYLLGLKGPAQCVNFEDGPMKVHLVPRNGGKPIVIDGVEPSFLIHHANAYEEGEEVVVWSSGWSPEAVRVLATSSGSGMLGSWKVVMDGDFNDVPVSSLWSHRINTRTGEVKRHCLFAQSNDHPRVNPSFYSRPTRYVYINMCMTEDADISNPPQVSSDSVPPLPPPSTVVPLASNIVPAPAFLGRTLQSIPQPAAQVSALPGLSGVSWTTEGAGSSDSLLPPAVTLPMSLPLSLHAYAICDTTPYTEVPLPVGGAPAEPANILRQSFNTAKERLSRLSRLSISDALASFDHSSSDSSSSSFESSYDQATGEGLSSMESSMEEEAFPVTASKLNGKTAGSTRDMGSLEWLNLCSGPPKAKLLTSI
ncbi:TPA: hypothetical protein ACH3X2_014183 [Trebouxia sp. C0005]